MGMIQEKPGVGIAIVVVALLVVGYMMFGRSGGAVEPGSRYYYDVSTGELVAFKPDQPLPPVTLPSGNEGVLAHVFACGDCGSDQYVGYLQKYTDEYKQVATQEVTAESGPVAPPMSGDLVARKPDGTGEPQWFSSVSPQGNEIIHAARSKCGEGTSRNAPRLVSCLPE